jgi:hypothetical protein
VRGFIEIVECKVVDTTLAVLATPTPEDKCAYLAQQLPQDHKESHEIPRVTREDTLCIATAHVLCSSAHSRRDDFAGRVHQQFGEPFEDLLDDLGVRFLQVRDAEFDANVGNTSCNLVVGLRIP